MEQATKLGMSYKKTDTADYQNQLSLGRIVLVSWTLLWNGQCFSDHAFLLESFIKCACFHSKDFFRRPICGRVAHQLIPLSLALEAEFLLSFMLANLSSIAVDSSNTPFGQTTHPRTVVFNRISPRFE